MRTPLPYGAIALAVLLLSTGCDHGLEPPERAPDGSISATVTYLGEWPPASEVVDFRFVAMRFVPQDTLDFLQLNRMAISGRLAYGVERDSFTVQAVQPGVFVYTGIAQQQTSDILSWRPVGLLDGDGGLFTVEPGANTPLSITVDFDNLPVFPPEDL